jgi:hypothetical protein
MSTIKKLDGKATIMAFTKISTAHNAACEKYVEKLRGNELRVAKRIIYDYRKAFNEVCTCLPMMYEHEGMSYLRTASALIAAREERSMSPRTAKRCLDRLAKRGGLIEKMENFGNDVLIMINPAYLTFYEQDTTPYKPPEQKGKADMEAHGLSKHDLSRLARLNTKWHHSEL